MKINWYMLVGIIIYAIFFLAEPGKCKTIAGGPQEQQPCIFPFKYKTKVHNECIWENEEDSPWCSTKVKINGVHVGGQEQWGYCGQHCPIAPKGSNAHVCGLFAYNI